MKIRKWILVVLIPVVCLDGVIGAIVAGLSDARIGSLTMIALVILEWLGWITWQIIAIRRRDKESNFLDKPLKITFTRRNCQKVDSDFLRWPQCAIMFWVLVPPKGEGLRNSPSNRYLLAHNTGSDKSSHPLYWNVFSLRHNSNDQAWLVGIANSKGEGDWKAISVPDGLEAGWHHFMITWDRWRPLLVLSIDAGKGGSNHCTTMLSSWPEGFSPTVSVGSWVPDYEVHYCETEICHLSIVNAYVTPSHPIVKRHLLKKPRPERT